MHALRIIVGVAFALAALFVGGCSLLFGGIFLIEGDSGGYDFWVIPVAGIAVAPFLGWGAWALLKGQVGGRGGDGRPGPARLAGAALCALAALYFLSRVALTALVWPAGMALTYLWFAVMYLALTALAAWGAWHLMSTAPRSGRGGTEGEGSGDGPPPPD
jgi:hypothetical protein